MRMPTPPISRAYLMCPPDHFGVQYAINPWMDPGRPVDSERAGTQWRELREVLKELGHVVVQAPARRGLPDMVFTANAATVIDGRVLVATFRCPQRAGESALFEHWFRENGYQPVARARGVNEGQGDHLVANGMILAGHGLRTDSSSHEETSSYFGLPVVGLTLTDPRFFHLDTALAVLNEREIMYYPGAFSPQSLRVLRSLFPDSLEADDADAAVFGLNAISDGRRVVLPAAATGLAQRLAQRGFEPIPVEVEELLKAGGGPKCCVLDLRTPPTTRTPVPVPQTEQTEWPGARSVI
ncbi:amidinotransferase [Actinospica durhamensis]|uniref:Amidinotransferase n=1 Tax=Actinospica durhamensis TaxID=1508375 RepID=A0A941ELN9_9ACTN|nr:dimethylargininase [Actinospica durhamensis]MBR7834710.1 amidinotransferase [Actinospica durhamensis]